MTEHASHGRPPSFLRVIAPLLGLVLAGLIAAVVVSSFEGGDPVPAAPSVATPPPPSVTAEAVEAAPAPAVVELPVSPTEPPARSDEVQPLEDRFALELRTADERELVRLRAAGDRPGSVNPRFDWLPDRDDASGVTVARRMAREARERISESQDELANLILEAHLQERVGDPDAARARCDQALDLDPRCGMAWIVRGWARLARGDVDGAELDLLRGELLSGDSAWAPVGLGRVAEARGQPNAAILAYRQGLKRGASNASVDHDADLRARIERLSARAR